MKQIYTLFLLCFFASCTSTKVIDLGRKASLKGTEVAQKGLDLYAVLAQQADLDKSFRDEVKILTNPNPSTMALPDTRVTDFSKQLAPRIKAYQGLLHTYKAFSLLTSAGHGDKTQQATAALQESYNAIGQLPDLPEKVSSKLPEVSKSIMHAVQAKKIKAHNEVLSALSSLYLALWEADQPAWNDYIERVYGDYAKDLNAVDTKRYDLKKIQDELKGPYSDDSVLLLMYRLRKRDEIMKQKNALKKQLNDFGKALNELNQAHVEMARSKTDVADVTNLLRSIETHLTQP